FATFFSVVEYSCTFLCYKLPMLKRIHRKHKRHIHKRHIKEFDPDEEEEDNNDDGSFSYQGSRRSRSHHCRDYRGDHLRRSLQPRSHRIQVGIRGNSVHVNKRRCPIKYGDHHGRTVHDIIVTPRSKFAKKGARYNGSFRRTRRK
ncbi:hypothetical protein U1Q18_037133, partial [Sarracenia purpurea var. burkii]